MMNKMMEMMMATMMNNEEFQKTMMESMMQTMMQTMMNQQVQSPVQVPTQEPVQVQAPVEEEKKTTGFWKKPVVAKWTVGTQKVNRTNWYYIDTENHWKSWSAPSQLARKAIEDGINKTDSKETWEEIKVSYKKADGTKGTKTRWANKLKSNVELLIKELPGGFLPETLNNYKPEKKSTSKVDYSDFI